jgi:hypothetical protein
LFVTWRKPSSASSSDALSATAILRNAVKEKGRRQKGIGTEIIERFNGIGLDEPIRKLRGFPIKPPKFDE